MLVIFAGDVNEEDVFSGLQVGKTYEGEDAHFNDIRYLKIGSEMYRRKCFLNLEDILRDIPYDTLTEELARRRHEATTKWKFGITC